MPAAKRLAHVVLAIAAAFVVGVAIFLAMRGSDVVDPVAGAQPDAPPVVITASEPAAQAAPTSNSPRVASSPASSSAQRDPVPHTPAKTDASQWKSWRDVPPIDREHALDRLANWVAMGKEGKSDENSVQWNRQFESHPVDVELTDEVSANIQQSFANLDADVQRHFTFGTVECRGDTCQMLAAVNGYIYNGLDNTSQTPLNIQQMYDVMTGQPWWSQSGWKISNTSVYTSEGYVLYGIYFVRPVK
ncbi:hypothetical protein [Rudaea sp.]|uniref:hypothetical protein n=1 Tax=Rudaea sp. TaxID=2136325 RepID=UPI0032202696